MENLRLATREGVLFAALMGEVTLVKIEDIKSRLDQALEDESRDFLVLDLDKVTFIDSSGIGFLVSLATRLKGQGRRFILFRPSEPVIKLLNLVKLTSFFELIEDKDELLALLPD